MTTPMLRRAPLVAALMLGLAAFVLAILVAWMIIRSRLSRCMRILHRAAALKIHPQGQQAQQHADHEQA